METTRLGLMSLLSSHCGSVALPEEITMYCPRCKTKCMDKGQCAVEVAKFPPKNGGEKMEAKLIVDCRVCGCYGESPLVDF